MSQQYRKNNNQGKSSTKYLGGGGWKKEKNGKTFISASISEEDFNQLPSRNGYKSFLIYSNGRQREGKNDPDFNFVVFTTSNDNREERGDEQHQYNPPPLKKAPVTKYNNSFDDL